MWETDAVFVIFIQFLYIWRRFRSFSVWMVVLIVFELLEFFIEDWLFLEKFLNLVVKRVLVSDSLNLLEIESFEDKGVDLNWEIGIDLVEAIILDFILFSFDKLCNFIRTLYEVSEMRVFKEVVLGVFKFHINEEEVCRIL